MSGVQFVGRERQLNALDQGFARASTGRPTVALVVGDPGVGKSTLLARAVAHFAGSAAVVLRAVGDEAESGWDLGILGQLLAGVSPSPALLSRLAQSGEGLNPLSAGVELLDMLGELQERGSVVLVVDDIPWGDSASLHALSFCLRRLRAERVLAVLAARRDDMDKLPRGLTSLAQDPTGFTVTVDGMLSHELVELARALGAGELSPRTAERLARHTAGNPLLATALLQELGAAALSAPEGLQSHAPRSFSTVVLARLSACGPSGRELALAGSVLGMHWPVALAARVAGIDDPLLAADEACAAGLITVERAAGATPTGVFNHPLTQAALYRQLPLTRRAGLHRAAAAAAEDPREALRHRVEAEIGSDPELAADLVTAARRDAAAGTWASAARAYLWAARVAVGAQNRERYEVEAAVCLLLAGDVGEARALVDQASALADTAQSHLARGYLAWTDGAFVAAERQLQAAWDLACTAGDPELAARAGDLLSSLCVYLGRGGEGITWAERALRVHPDPVPGTNRRTSLLVGYGISGRATEGLTHAAGLAWDETDVRRADGRVGRGTLRLWVDDPAGAQEDLLPVVEACLRHGPLDAGMFAAVHLADAEWRLGRWEEALLHAEAAVSAAAHALHGWFIAEAHAVAAFPVITRGDWSPAEAHVEAAVRTARRVGYGHGTLWAIVARARLADARGEPDGVLHALTPLLDFTAVDGVDHPGVHSWRELFGTALVAVGQTESAGKHADALDDQSQHLGLRSAHARAARLRGLIELANGRYDAATGFFKEALAELETLSLPFDTALVRADLGATLRRAGQRRAAAQLLRQAERALTRLGAAPYLRRIERELAANGLEPARTGDTAHQRLSPAELAVARLVVSGKSNRQVASELVLSAKTVEHHLSRIYYKLGISSRTQLARRLVGD